MASDTTTTTSDALHAMFPPQNRVATLLTPNLNIVGRLDQAHGYMYETRRTHYTKIDLNPFVVVVDACLAALLAYDRPVVVIDKPATMTACAAIDTINSVYASNTRSIGQRYTFVFTPASLLETIPAYLTSILDDLLANQEYNALPHAIRMLVAFIRASSVNPTDAADACGETIARQIIRAFNTYILTDTSFAANIGVACRTARISAIMSAFNFQELPYIIRIFKCPAETDNVLTAPAALAIFRKIYKASSPRKFRPAFKPYARIQQPVPFRGFDNTLL